MWSEWWSRQPTHYRYPLFSRSSMVNREELMAIIFHIFASDSIKKFFGVVGVINPVGIAAL